MIMRKHLLTTILVLIAGAACFAAVPVRKTIALSFDDGPNTITTPVVLDVLEEFGVKASFFVIGRNIDSSSTEVMKRARALGCDIENHTFSHPHLTELSDDEIISEIHKTQDSVSVAISVAPRFCRPPYLDVDERVFGLIAEAGLTVIGGVNPEDWNPDVNTSERARRILDKAEDGQIILLHDFWNNDQTVEALKIIIPELRNAGYEFVTVPELFDLKQVTLRAGVMYSNVFD